MLTYIHKNEMKKMLLCLLFPFDKDKLYSPKPARAMSSRDSEPSNDLDLLDSESSIDYEALAEDYRQDRSLEPQELRAEMEAKRPQDARQQGQDNNQTTQGIATAFLRQTKSGGASVRLGAGDLSQLEAEFSSMASSLLANPTGSRKLRPAPQAQDSAIRELLSKGPGKEKEGIVTKPKNEDKKFRVVKEENMSRRSERDNNNNRQNEETMEKHIENKTSHDIPEKEETIEIAENPEMDDLASGVFGGSQSPEVRPHKEEDNEEEENYNKEVKEENEEMITVAEEGLELVPQKIKEENRDNAVSTTTDGTLRFFYTTAEQDPLSEGRCMLFGKILMKSSSSPSSPAFDSCCVHVSGLRYELHLLPRVSPLKEGVEIEESMDTIPGSYLNFAVVGRLRFGLKERLSLLVGDSVAKSILDAPRSCWFEAKTCAWDVAKADSVSKEELETLMPKNKLAVWMVVAIPPSARLPPAGMTIDKLLGNSTNNNNKKKTNKEDEEDEDVLSDEDNSDHNTTDTDSSSPFAACVGTTLKPLNVFMLRAGIKGPGWIEIASGKYDTLPQERKRCSVNHEFHVDLVSGSEVQVVQRSDSSSTDVQSAGTMRAERSQVLTVLPLRALSQFEAPKVPGSEGDVLMPTLTGLSFKVKYGLEQHGRNTNTREEQSLTAVGASVVFIKALSLTGAPSETERSLKNFQFGALCRKVKNTVPVLPNARGSIPASLRTRLPGIEGVREYRTARAVEIRYDIGLCNTEAVLLDRLLELINRLDPDVIIAHSFYDELQALIERVLSINKGAHWHHTGRLRGRLDIAALMRRRQGSFRSASAFTRFVLMPAATLGRLVVDTSKLTKEFAPGDVSRSLALPEVVGRLHGEGMRYKVTPVHDVVEAFGHREKPSLFMGLFNETVLDALASVDIMYTLNVLPLTLQISCITTHRWNRVLSSGRAERVESLLNVELKTRGYIVPDNMSTVEDSRGGERGTQDTQRGKPKYKGGYVLDPVVGLHETYVVVLDFNSLYPSIIDEFNLCFTTLETNPELISEGQDAAQTLPQPIPDSSLPRGVLPQVVSALVGRRGAVKAAIRSLDRRLTSASESGKQGIRLQLAQLDIRQLAFKLIANSLYGCLGFQKSRYYSPAIASMVTTIGRREIHVAKHIAELERLDVVYGDTDSIMVDTKEPVPVGGKPEAEAVKRVLALGRELCRKISQGYRVLKMDIDHVFRHLLLQTKKKYAAVEIQPGSAEDPAHAKDTLLPASVFYRGLDLVRRDWAILSRRVSEALLCLILAPEKWHPDPLFAGFEVSSRADKADAILSLLGVVSGEIRKGIEIEPGQEASLGLSIGDFLISIELSRDLSAYKSKPLGEDEGPSLHLYESVNPHVSVGLRMKNHFNREPKSGSVVDFVVCSEESVREYITWLVGEENNENIEESIESVRRVLSGQLHESVRAFPLFEVASSIQKHREAAEKVGSTNLTTTNPSTTNARIPPCLVPDYEYYIARQVFPPVARLLVSNGIEVIPGISSDLLARAMNIDAKKYATALRVPGTTAAGAGASQRGIYESIPEVTGGTRFDSCECFHCVCPDCGRPVFFPPLSPDADIQRTEAGDVAIYPRLSDRRASDRLSFSALNALRCPSCDSAAVSKKQGVLVDALRHMVERQTAALYQGFYTCSEPSCPYHIPELIASIIVRGSDRARAELFAQRGMFNTASMERLFGASGCELGEALVGWRSVTFSAGRGKCLNPLCSGRRVPLVSVETLVNQVLFLAGMFDGSSEIYSERTVKEVSPAVLNCQGYLDALVRNTKVMHVDLKEAFELYSQAVVGDQEEEER